MEIEFIMEDLRGKVAAKKETELQIFLISCGNKYFTEKKVEDRVICNFNIFLYIAFIFLILFLIYLFWLL